MTTIDLDQTAVESFAHQVAAAVTGGATTAMMVIGDRLGLYTALAESGPVTPAQLAARTGTVERLLREWLAQQAATGFLEYDAHAGTFLLRPERAAVLAGDESPASMIGAAPLVTGLHRGIDRLIEAYRSGAGIPWGEQDRAVLESTERFFRTGYRSFLLSQWLPALDGVRGSSPVAAVSPTSAAGTALLCSCSRRPSRRHGSQGSTCTPGRSTSLDDGSPTPPSRRRSASRSPRRRTTRSPATISSRSSTCCTTWATRLLPPPTPAGRWRRTAH